MKDGLQYLNRKGYLINTRIHSAQDRRDVKQRVVLIFLANFGGNL
jgi:hypothetical protein